MSVYETMGFIGTIFFFCVGFAFCFAMMLAGSWVTYQTLIKGGDRVEQGLRIVAHLPFRADPSFIEDLKTAGLERRRPATEFTR